MRSCARAAGLVALLGNLVAARGAHATGALSAVGHTPVEQRVVLAVGPDRTTLWTSLRLEGPAGDVAVVAPAAPGSTLDFSSPAWIEALDVATAPRVFPPPGLDATCPGDPTLYPFHVTTETASIAPLAPLEVLVHDDAASVALWASQNGLAMSPAFASALATFGASRFVAVRFAASGGPALTATLRVVAPTPNPTIPLVLSEGGAASDLLVTTFVIGAGRGALAGTTEIEIDPVDLTFVAAGATSDYAELRAAALEAGGPTAALVEAASHESLAENLPIAQGTAAIEGVLAGYVERAAFYGDGLTTITACVAAGGAALASGQPVAPSCPRADLGVVDGVDTCSEVVGPGQTDPEALRCGPGADDLAVALSGLVPADAWLTRTSTLIPAGELGEVVTVSASAGAAQDPVIEAGNLDLSGCSDGGAGGAGGAPGQGGAPVVVVGGSGSGASSSGGGGPRRVPVYEYDATCACSGTYVIVDEIVTEDDDVDAYYRDEDGCSGDTETYESESYEEDEDCGGGEPAESAESDDGGCGSDTSETASDDDGSSDDGSSDDGSSDDGSSDDGSSDDGSSESSSDDCGSDSSESSSDDGCGSDTSDTSSGDDGCAVYAKRRGPERREERPRRARGPRLSVWLFLMGLVAFPLRRLTRASRRVVSRAPTQGGKNISTE